MFYSLEIRFQVYYMLILFGNVKLWFWPTQLSECTIKRLQFSPTLFNMSIEHRSSFGRAMTSFSFAPHIANNFVLGKSCRVKLNVDNCLLWNAFPVVRNGVSRNIVFTQISGFWRALSSLVLFSSYASVYLISWFFK